MNTNQALEILEAMPETEFQTFFQGLPERVKLLVKAGFVDWRETLPKWYIKYIEGGE